VVQAFAVYVGPALAKIAGGFAFWAWPRLDRAALWVLPAMLSLALFAFPLTQIDAAFAGSAAADGHELVGREQSAAVASTPMLVRERR
jgi:small multidrug resistance family-3 protein